MKGNVDGSVRQGSGLTACGGVFRYASGWWVSGFMRTLGTSNVLMVELWGILMNLYMA